MPRRGHLWAVAALLAGLPSSAFAQPYGQLTAIVTDAVGLPAAGAVVSVQGPVERRVLTSEAGPLTLTLRPGAYDVAATHGDLASATHRVVVEAGATVTVELVLHAHVLERAVVTAARTGGRDLQTVPMAVSVVAPDELARLNVHTVEQLAGLAPSVTFSQNTGFAQLTIRGIGTNAIFAGSDPSSSIYLDGVYLARPAMALNDFLDVERVEVLRGPQGTLYGRNAVGGALHVVTRTPGNDLEAAARVSGGSLGMLRSEIRASGPLVKGRVMAGASFLRGVADGFVRDLDHPGRPLGGEDVTAARAQVRVVLSPKSDLLISGDVTHQDPEPLTYARVLAVKSGFDVDRPPGFRDVRTSYAAEGRNLQFGTSARFTFAPTPSTLVTSLTAFRKLDYHVVIDGDITERDLTVSDVHEIQHQISEELTVAYQRPAFSWISGLFFFSDVDRQPTSVRLGGPRVDNRFEPEVESRSTAVFSQATVPVTRMVSLTAGVRYTDERKDIDNAGYRLTLDAPFARVPGFSYAYTDAISHVAWTPKAGVEFRTGPSMLAYASATRGFKSGGFNLTSTQPGRGFAPESAWSFEGGVKTVLGQGRGRLNAALFHTDYHDLQVQTTIRPGVVDISNAAEATIRGVEIDGATDLAGGLQAGGHLAWLDSTYDRYVAVGVGGVTGDVSGNRLSNVPEWSGRTWVEWTRAMAGRRLSVRADARWQLTVYFTPFNDTVQRQRGYGLLDVSAEYGPASRRLAVSIFGRNLTGEDYITGTFSSPPPAVGGRPGPPRQVGVQLVFQR